MRVVYVIPLVPVPVTGKEQPKRVHQDDCGQNECSQPHVFIVRMLDGDGDGDISPHEHKWINAVTIWKADHDSKHGANEQDDDRPCGIAESPAVPLVLFQCHRDVDDGSDGYPAKVQTERQLDEPHFPEGWLRRTSTHIYDSQREQVQDNDDHTQLYIYILPQKNPDHVEDTA